MLRASGLILLTGLLAPAQYVVSTHAGVIQIANGQVAVDDQPVHIVPTKILELSNGQTLTTERGRAEILVGPHTYLRLGNRSAIRMRNGQLDNAEVEVLRGTALVEVVSIPKGTGVHIVFGPTRIDFRSHGLYRFNADLSELRVFGGEALVSAGPAEITASRGRIIHLGDALSVTTFDPHREAAPGVRPSKDSLHQWSARRSYSIFNSNLPGSRVLGNWEVRKVPAEAFKDKEISSDQDRYYLMNRDFDVMFYAVPGGRGGRAP